ncbi:MAG TPA: hypothetical protein VGZ03_01015 [Acidimicrobiales bacterium]|nr:hypothetical protein [Acidimicrobiales bacterium]
MDLTEASPQSRQLRPTVAAFCAASALFLITGLFVPWVHVNLSASCIWGSYSTGPFHARSTSLADGIAILFAVVLLGIAVLKGFGTIHVQRPAPRLWPEISAALIFVVIALGISGYQRPAICAPAHISSAPGVALTWWGFALALLALLGLPVGTLTRSVRGARLRRSEAASSRLSSAANLSRRSSLETLVGIVSEMQNLFRAQAAAHGDDLTWTPASDSQEALQRSALNRRLEGALGPLEDRFYASSSVQRLTVSYDWKGPDLEAAAEEAMRELARTPAN